LGNFDNGLDSGKTDSCPICGEKLIVSGATEVDELKGGNHGRDRKRKHSAERAKGDGPENLYRGCGS